MLRFDVDGMTCGHCVKAVTEAVHALDRDADVAVDLKAKRVTVRTAALPERIAHAIDDAGYTARIA